MNYFLAFSAALAIAGIAGAIIAYIYQGDPNAVDDECSRVDDLEKERLHRRIDIDYQFQMHQGN